MYRYHKLPHEKGFEISIYSIMGDKIKLLGTNVRKKEILVRVILVTEILESENLDPENPVLGNFRPRNASAWKGQCKEISEQGNPSAR